MSRATCDRGVGPAGAGQAPICPGGGGRDASRTGSEQRASCPRAGREIPRACAPARARSARVPRAPRAPRVGRRPTRAARPLGLFGPGVALARRPRPSQSEIETTQGVIDRASGSLRCPPGDAGLACTYYGQGLSLQASARASYASGFLRDALAPHVPCTRPRVFRPARGPGRDRRRVRSLFARAHGRAARSHCAAGARVVGRSRRNGSSTWPTTSSTAPRAAADGGRPRLALAATFQARDRGLSALRVADGAALATPERARTMLDRTDDLLRAEAWLADAGASSDPYRRAIDCEARAHARLDSGDVKRAIELSLQARDALAHALGKADRPLGRAAVERQLTDNASALESARVRADDDPAARDHLARAEQHHRQAQEHFRAGHPGTRRGRGGSTGSSCLARAPGVPGRRDARAGAYRPRSAAAAVDAGPPRDCAPWLRILQPPFPGSIR